VRTAIAAVGDQYVVEGHDIVETAIGLRHACRGFKAARRRQSADAQRPSPATGSLRPSNRFSTPAGQLQLVLSELDEQVDRGVVGQMRALEAVIAARAEIVDRTAKGSVVRRQVRPHWPRNSVCAPAGSGSLHHRR
jgi:hypothetical protein